MIYNIKQVKSFFNIITDLKYGNLHEKINNIEETVWFSILMARKKYLNGSNVNIPQTLPLQKFIIRDFDNFIKKLDRIKFDRFTDKNNNIIPTDALALYISLNPRDIKNASKKVAKEIIDLSFDNNTRELRRLEQVVYKSYHKSPLKCGRAVIDIDIDYDRRDNIITDRKMVELNVTDVIIRYCISMLDGLKMIVKTRGGLHIYLDLTKLNHNQNKYLFNKFKPDLLDYLNTHDIKEYIKEIEIDTDPLVVIPGTLQGGYKTKIVWLDGGYYEQQT